jgi:hypothetical protein
MFRLSSNSAHVWDPKNVHSNLIYLPYYGSVCPEDDFFKSKLRVASLHTDNKVMCFRLISILSSYYKHIGMAPIKMFCFTEPSSDQFLKTQYWYIQRKRN